ncbi:site-specific integrase [Novosphingobium sp. SG720]|uniref:tyrosine-type recombinase/integrase n=1 Tax=Novosphingobium sp. SG720 TaxID=2586998 RepID=UPI0014462E2B|nr:site-specific integrase [Novosphingobium sp. SG720]NKJ44828.1 integrase [Novosphingobium sp. SG720]
MSRPLHKLSSRRISTLSAPGWYGDGGGLYLRIKTDGSKRWVFTYERNKRRREMGLGAVADVSLAKAREEAAAARQLLSEGLDPIEQRRATGPLEPEQKPESEPEIVKQTGAPLFGPFAEAYIDTQEEGWKNPKHRQQWRNTIKTHGESLLAIPVDAITVDDVVAVLQPIWRSTPETAGRLRGRIENILDAAKASKHIAGPWENPARWRGNLIHLLPRRRKKSQVRHHPAMPYEDLPDFIVRLRRRSALAARALEFTILCATRTNETLRMTWSEVDLDGGVWNVAADRMKMGVGHRIPLPGRAVEILREIAKGSNCDPGTFVFEGQKMGKPLSQMSMTMVLRRMKLGHYTVHGMRSAFRDYMGDMTNHPESVVEQALAHQIGDETTRAYRRGDAFLKRRELMKDWEGYLDSKALKSKQPKGRSKPDLAGVAA